MTLSDLLGQLTAFDAESTIYVDALSPISAAIESCVSDPPDELDSLPAGKRELLDVWHATDILTGCHNMLAASGSPVTHDALVLRFLQYLESDS